MPFHVGCCFPTAKKKAALGDATAGLEYLSRRDSFFCGSSLCKEQGKARQVEQQLECQQVREAAREARREQREEDGLDRELWALGAMHEREEALEAKREAVRAEVQGALVLAVTNFTPCPLEGAVANSIPIVRLWLVSNVGRRWPGEDAIEFAVDCLPDAISYLSLMVPNIPWQLTAHKVEGAVRRATWRGVPEHFDTVFGGTEWRAARRMPNKKRNGRSYVCVDELTEVVLTYRFVGKDQLKLGIKITHEHRLIDP